MDGRNILNGQRIGQETWWIVNKDELIDKMRGVINQHSKTLVQMKNVIESQGRRITYLEKLLKDTEHGRMQTFQDMLANAMRGKK